MRVIMKTCHSCSIVVHALAALAAACLSTRILACDTWVALGNSTRDGSVIMAKNSDRKITEAQPLVYFARTRHPEGSMVKCTDRSIPQVAETYEHIGSQLSWTFGYEHGLNEWGVAIGNEAIKSKVPPAKAGLIGMDLIRLALERGRTAYEAMHVIIDHLELQGRGSNSFIVADPSSAWVLETAGKYWAAKKVTDVYAISNIYTIERDFDEAHPDLIKHAIAQGWCSSEETFNFSRCYTRADKDYSEAHNRACQVSSLLHKHKGGITVELVMNEINRSHHEGTIEAPKWSPNDGWFSTVCMHNGPNHGRTSASMVAHLRKDNPPLLRSVYWASFSSPCVNVFKPFYFAGRTVPESYGIGKDIYNAESPWWWAERVKRQCDLNYNKLAPLAAAVFRETEQWELAKSRRIENEVTRLSLANREDEARQLLRDFSRECCARIEKEYAQLHALLDAKIVEFGVDYLQIDALREANKTNALVLPGL